MKDIKTIIVSTIADDVTFKALTGATATDGRLYQHFPPQEVDGSNPWVTYYFSSGGLSSPQTGDVQVPDILLSIDVWGLDADAVEDVASRIQTLLNRQELNPTGHRVVHTRFEGANDLVETEATLATVYHKNCQYRLYEILEIN